MQPSTSSDLIQKYNARLAQGVLRVDSAQLEVLEIMQHLADKLLDYRPLAVRQRLAQFFNPSQHPLGIYLYGDVGRGKSMLMDLFFDFVSVAKKRRVHFHQFMLDVHARLHFLQSLDKAVEDVIDQLARDLSQEAWLLAFDEFHVGNIADAMILGRLFQALFEHGVVIVATSNWPPDDLYKNGLQRDRFLPFIELIKRRMTVVCLKGAVDHRYEQLKGTPSYFWPLSREATIKLEALFHQISGDVSVKRMELPVGSRTLIVERAARDIAFLTFDELCTQPLSSADFLVLAECFAIVLIDGVLQFTAEQRNETQRFIWLIDALYEKKTKLYLTATVAPENLCLSGALAFDFHRTVSRLVEMQSEEYRQKAHLSQ